MNPEQTLIDLDQGRLPAGGFDHRAHLHVAWHLARTLPLEEAIARMCGALRRFTAAVGQPGKFHTTLTWAWMVIVAQRMAGERDFDAFIAANPDLLDARDTIARHYPSTVFADPRARRTFVLPEVA